MSSSSGKGKRKILDKSSKSSDKRATVIWSTFYNQGALQGTCTYDGNLCWFELESGDINTVPVEGRRFVIYGLNEEQQKQITAEHENFRTHSGYHHEHDPDMYRFYQETNPHECTTYDFTTDTEQFKKNKITVLPITSMDRYELPDKPFECEPVDPEVARILGGMKSYEDFEQFMANGGTF